MTRSGVNMNSLLFNNSSSVIITDSNVVKIVLIYKDVASDIQAQQRYTVVLQCRLAHALITVHVHTSRFAAAVIINRVPFTCAVFIMVPS